MFSFCKGQVSATGARFGNHFPPAFDSRHDSEAFDRELDDVRE